ncbi:MAG: extracellular solute-binding protein [Hyphomicrobiales bacterium]|nr:MAG: extracellular solute-binding protein [Hyphomicrobiales bacterium]
MTNRRDFLRLAGSATALAASGLPAWAQSPTTLRFAWWGNDARHALHNKLLDLYQSENPHVTIEREFSGFDPYFQRLSTQAAGGNAPDLISMHLTQVAGYADQGVLLPLDEYIANGTIDLGNFSQSSIDTGRRNGKVFMITQGLSPRAVLINPSIFERAAVEPPQWGWTLEDFVEKVIAIRKNSPDGVYGTLDQGDQEIGLDSYMGQIGKSTFAGAEGKTMGFTPEDLLTYWGYWGRMRDAGALPEPGANTELIVQAGIHADSPYSKSRVGVLYSNPNQLKLYQRHSQDELHLIEVPRSNAPGAKPYYYVGGAFLSIHSRSPNLDAAAKLLNWWINDPEAGVIFNGEQGRPGSKAIQDLIRPDLDPADQRMYEYYNRVEADVVADPPAPPQASELRAALTANYQEWQFGRATLEQAVETFFSDAEFIFGG